LFHAAGVGRSASGQRMSKRILVVEDQPDNRQILRDLLTNADFEVLEAVDGEAGLAAAAAHQPDLILMDIHLPGIDAYEPPPILMDIQFPGFDGYEATRRLKADAVLQAIPRASGHPDRAPDAVKATLSPGMKRREQHFATASLAYRQ